MVEAAKRVLTAADPETLDRAYGRGLAAIDLDDAVAVRRLREAFRRRRRELGLLVTPETEHTSAPREDVFDDDDAPPPGKKGWRWILVVVVGFVVLRLILRLMRAGG